MEENKEFNIDEALSRLEEINNKLSDKNASLDESIKLYNEGSELAKKCQEH
ncbi:MAG: exodeoxyribonuclease VII small subunit, partial [Lachnospiraceae bacterium]|nr:exodeoxyribonuclease VII small subunit [Lachnospiraceae bacterium]